jgi:hypothetical protein
VDGRYFYPVYALTAPGLDRMLENQSRFKLRADNPPEVADEDSVLAPIVAGKERSAGCAAPVAEKETHPAGNARRRDQI